MEKAAEPEPGVLPGIGTKLEVNGNIFRIVWKRENPIRYTIELWKRYEPKE